MTQSFARGDRRQSLPIPSQVEAYQHTSVDRVDHVHVVVGLHARTAPALAPALASRVQPVLCGGVFVLWCAAASTALCILWVRRFEPGRSGIKLSLYGMAFVLLCAAAPVLRYDVPYSV